VWIRQRHRKLALKCHYVLAVVAIAAIEYHLFQQGSGYRWVLLGVVCVWFLCSLVVCMRAILTHKQWQGSHCKADIWVSQGVLWIEINLPIDRATRPDQYVHMWGAMCRLSRLHTACATLCGSHGAGECRQFMHHPYGCTASTWGPLSLLFCATSASRHSGAILATARFFSVR
jgi:hypothetical protein